MPWPLVGMQMLLISNAPCCSLYKCITPKKLCEHLRVKKNSNEQVCSSTVGCTFPMINRGHLELPTSHCTIVCLQGIRWLHKYNYSMQQELPLYLLLSAPAAGLGSQTRSVISIQCPHATLEIEGIGL